AINSSGTFRAYRRPIDNRDYDRDSRYYNESGTITNRTSSGRVVLPAGTVIPVRLDDHLRSDQAVPGDRFTATIEAGRDDAGIPAGTRFEGVVREAIPSRNGKPGVMDMDFRKIIFPNGTSKPISASLASMDSSRLVRDSSGRL